MVYEISICYVLHCPYIPTVQLSRFRTKTRSNECFTRSLLGVKLGRLLDGCSVDRASPRSLRDYVME